MATKKTKKTRARSTGSSARRPARRARTAPRARTQPGALALSSAEPSFTVGDLERSLAWYRDVLGFAVGNRWERDGRLTGVEMSAGGTTFMLGQDDWQKGRDRVKGVGFRVYAETRQDVDRLAERIKAHGGRLAEEPRDEPWGARVLAVEDPDGFQISIYRMQRRGR